MANSPMILDVNTGHWRPGHADPRTGRPVFDAAIPPHREKTAATLYLNGEITSSMERDFIEACREIPKGLDDLFVRIDSIGGQVQSAIEMSISLEHTMAQWITTICTGKAYSAAALVFATGDKRLMTRDAAVMLHPVSIDGNKDSSAAREWTRQTSRFLAERCGIDQPTIEEWKRRHSYFDCDAAVAAGLATGLDFATRSRSVANIDGKYQPMTWQPAMV